MKIGVCCIIKMENIYLRDYVEYYKQIGVSNIILYDNNDETGEYPQQVIGDYIESGFVVYENVRGKYRYQLEAYEQCYAKYKTWFDWIGFFDADEFLYIDNGKKAEELLSSDMYKSADIIPIYWVSYGDNGLVHYDSRPVYERFTTPYNMEKNETNTFKLFVRCRDYITLSFLDANAITFFSTGGPVLAFLSNGKNVDLSLDFYKIWSYENMHLNHYHTLTIEEFLYRRFGRRSYADKASSYQKDKIMGIFWQFNEKTPEKEKIIENFFKDFVIKEDLAKS